MAILRKSLDCKLQQLTLIILTYIKDTEYFLNYLKAFTKLQPEGKLPKNARIFKADAISMYTNIDTDHDLKNLKVFLIELHKRGRTTTWWFWHCHVGRSSDTNSEMVSFCVWRFLFSTTPGHSYGNLSSSDMGHYLFLVAWKTCTDTKMLENDSSLVEIHRCHVWNCADWKQSEMDWVWKGFKQLWNSQVGTERKLSMLGFSWRYSYSQRWKNMQLPAAWLRK